MTGGGDGAVIRRMQTGDDATVLAAAGLFDAPPRPGAVRRFLADPTHHLLMAFDEAGTAIGFVSGVETTHPDKGTEMFLYELSVAPGARRRGVGTRLVEALSALAREAGCHGMWVATEPDNEAAMRTYERAGATREPLAVVLSWSFAG